MSHEDFVGSSRSFTFEAGSGESTRLAVFTTAQDEIPEKEESFMFKLSVINGDAGLGDIFVTTVTILPNDDAYGVFGFMLEDVRMRTCALNVYKVK